MEMKLDTRFQKKVRGMFGKYQFEVGVLQDAPYKTARRGVRGQGGGDVLSTYAGGPIRKRSQNESGKSISDISRASSDRLGFNYLTKPFQAPDSELLRFTKAFFDLVFGRSKMKRAENLLQAVVRNPILRGEYGTQSKLTTKIKGFYRPMIDTAQLFRALKAKCKVVTRV
jgi:hypothetical protein